MGLLWWFHTHGLNGLQWPTRGDAPVTPLLRMTPPPGPQNSSRELLPLEFTGGIPLLGLARTRVTPARVAGGRLTTALPHMLEAHFNPALGAEERPASQKSLPQGKATRACLLCSLPTNWPRPTHKCTSCCTMLGDVTARQIAGLSRARRIGCSRPTRLCSPSWPLRAAGMPRGAGIYSQKAGVLGAWVERPVGRSRKNRLRFLPCAACYC
jgi:hypothetical protein